MNQFLECFEKFIKENNGRVFSIAEMKGDEEPQRVEITETNACQNIYSVAKVFCVTAVGILCDRELLSVNETVADILGDECPEGFNRYWKQTTVDMLMRHRVGFEGGFDIDVFDASEYNPDYLREIMLRDWVCPPDTERRYNDGSYYIISRIVNKRARRPLFTFCWENIFQPLGFREAAWSCCPQGHAVGGTGLYIRSDDMVKLGGVYLNGGIYHGKRIVSEKWVERVLERQYEFSPIGIKDAYSKGGMNGQNLLVIPSENRVVGWQGHNRHSGGPDLTRFAAEYED